MTQIAQKTLRDHLQETEDAISKGRIDDAESKCQQVLALFPESLEAQRLLGEVLLAKDELENAQHSFDWVLTNDPENVIAYCDRALISEQQGDFDTALDCYQQAYELSRGNSKIRQEFNKLSQKAGQQGFMLSRAGLARLYMRGDLLTQAIQEWEAVLALTPDRLDARTGLLETYWREGLYDRVEQLASQVLQDVPGCEKALLLLSYVTSLKSMSQAQELIRRVEVLDPDLLMAHDLFSDLLASQPAEPFLDLLKKAPVVLSTSAAASNPAPQSPAASVEQGNTLLNGQSLPPTFTWESLESWPGNKNAEMKQELPEPRNGAPTLPIWPDTQQATGPNFASLSEPPSRSAEPMNSSPHRESQQEGSYWNISDYQEEPVMKSPEAQPEPWEMLQDALSKVNAEGGNLSTLPPEVWATLDQYLQTQTNSGPADEMQSLPAVDAPEPPTPARRENASPAWMSSLNQNERRQMSGSLPDASPVEPQRPSLTNRAPAPAQPTWSPPETYQSAPAEATPSAASYDPGYASPVWQEEQTDPTADAGDEDSFFGPAWLRSLGATGFEDEPAPGGDKDKTIVPEAGPTPMLPQYDMWPSSNSHQAKEEKASWMDAMNLPSDEKLPQPLQENEPSQPSEEYSWMSSLQPTPQAQPSNQEPSWMDSLRQSSEPSWLSSLQPAGEPSWMEALQQEAEAKTSPIPENTPSPAQEEDRYSWSSSFDAVPTQKNWERDSPSYTDTTNWTQPQSSEYAQSGSQEPAHDPLLATLRDLEQGLLAQGFVPLEPNSLSSLAGTEEKPGYLEPIQPTERKSQPGTEPSLSSALAELGGFAAQPPLAQPREPRTTNAPEEKPSQEAPFWSSPMQTPPAPTSLPPVAKDAPTRQEQPVARTPEPAPTPVQPPTYNATPVIRPASPRPSETPRRDEAVAGLNFRPSPAPAEPAPVVHIDPLLDSELETTMKRPAVRLQPMQQRGSKEQQFAPYTKARGADRSSASRGAEQGLTNQERLITGYQHQLVGDYDEAMQEYRIIIRNAPDLLGEVISNVRALLKLAPKYAAGYRVLGDAYMRQGEYLQAMEAYNKALTMAKKKA